MLSLGFAEVWAEHLDDWCAWSEFKDSDYITSGGEAGGDAEEDDGEAACSTTSEQLPASSQHLFFMANAPYAIASAKWWETFTCSFQSFH